MLPSLICGTSAGAVVAAAVCTHSDSQLDELLRAETLVRLLTSFDESRSSVIRRMASSGHMYDEAKWKPKIEALCNHSQVPNITLEEAFKLSGRELCVTVTARRKHEPPLVLSRLSAPDVTVASAVLATVATATLFVLTPSGPARRWGWSAVVLLLVVVSTGRVALGHDTASSEALSALLGCGLAAVAFHVLAPEGAFPVTFRRQVKAHLRLDGERRAAVTRAVREQLGLTLTHLEPYRLDGSAGSTPCRLRVAGPPDGLLFGKLYSSTHLHSDRWYKLARVLRYGRLEEQFAALGGYAAESDAARICTNLGLPDRVLAQPLRTLSGGQRRRVELARILFSDAETLLLAEPTNHLDGD